MKILDDAERALKGPADRVEELKRYRTKVIAKIQRGKDPEGRTLDGLKAQLQSIDSEIKRLTPPPSGFKQPR